MYYTARKHKLKVGGWERWDKGKIRVEYKMESRINISDAYHSLNVWLKNVVSLADHEEPCRI